MGCFWGAERLFWETPGVFSTQVGFAGGFTPNPSYKEVRTGNGGLWPPTSTIHQMLTPPCPAPQDPQPSLAGRHFVEDEPICKKHHPRRDLPRCRGGLGIPLPLGTWRGGLGCP